MQLGTPTRPQNRLPWIVAAVAIGFALVVLIRSELTPDRDAVVTAPPTATPSIQTPNTPPIAPNIQTHVAASSQQTAPTPPPTRAATPTPTPATYYLDGLVTDGDGKPVPGASVRGSYTQGSSQRTASAVADAKGEFRLADLQSPELDAVIVESVGYGRSVVEKLKLPLPDRLEIAVTALAGLNIAVLQVADNSDTGKPFQGEADFVLLQERQSAPSSATLGLSEASLAHPTFVPMAQQHVTVPSDGTLKLEELEPGTYKAALRAKDMYAEGSSFAIQGAHRTQTTITLGLKYAVPGTVMAEVDLHPIAQARVRLVAASTHALTGPNVEIQSQSDEQGRFVLPNVPPGDYLLTIGANGFTSKSVELLDLATTGAPVDTTYTLSQQQPAIRVTVLDGEGKPVQQARLVLMMTRPSSKTIFSQTDAAGVKLFDNVAPGTYSIAVTAAEDRTRQKSLELTLEDGQTTDIELVFPKTVHVQGHARKDGKPYRGLIAFTLRGSIGLQTMAKSDETGGYTVELEPGEYMAGSPEQSNAQIVNVRTVQAGNIDLEVK